MEEYNVEVLDKYGVAIDERSVLSLAASNQQLTKAVCMLANICEEQRKTNEALSKRIERLEDKLDRVGPCTKAGMVIDNIISCITDLFD